MSQKQMPLRKAIRVAETAMRAEMQKVAPEANVYRRDHIELPCFRNAYKKFEEMKEAISILNSLIC